MRRKGIRAPSDRSKKKNSKKDTKKNSKKDTKKKEKKEVRAEAFSDRLLIYL